MASIPAWAAKGETCGVAIGTYGLQALPLEDALQFVAKTGFDAVEITVFSNSTGDPKSLDAARRAKIRGILEQTGLRLTALMADVAPSADDAKNALQMEELRAIYKLGSDLSPERPPLVQTVLGGGKDFNAALPLFQRRLAEWLPIAVESKNILAVKPHRGNAMSTPAQAIQLFESLGSNPALRMVYDYSHYAFREMSIAQTVKEALPWTAYVAVKDAIQKDGAVRFILAGEGDAYDHAEIVKAFHAGGYRGDFCCEVSAQIWKNNPDYNGPAATETCYRNLSAAFQRAGVPRD